MHLKSLGLKNFCQHRRKDITFSGGVTGILGGNGQGKSNLLKAVRFALIKESGNAGNMAADLNWEAALAGESGFVELDFDKDGTEGRVKRFVDKGKASLKFGETKAGSSKAVEAAMADILGVPKRVIEEIVFVDQGAIERILFDKPAERSKQFQALFGTASAEIIRGLLQKELASLVDSPGDEQMARLQKQLDTVIDTELRTLAASRAMLAKAIEGFDEGCHNKVIEIFTVARALTAKIVEEQRTVTSLTADVDTGNRVVAGLQVQVTSLSATVDGGRDVVASKRERLGAIDLLKRASVMRASLEADSKAQDSILAEPLPTVPSVSVETVATGREDVAKVQAELAPKHSFVAAFKGGSDDATCPTCMQVVQNAGGLATQFETEISEQGERIARATATLNKAEQSLRLFETASRESTVRRELATKRLQEVDKQLSALGAVEYDPDEADSLRSELQAFAVKEKQLTELEQTLQTKKLALAATTSSLETHRVSLADFEAKVVDAPTQAERDESGQALKGFNDAKAQISGIDGQVSQLQNQRATVLTELEQLREEASKLESTRKYKELCERARTVLHRDCLPLIVTRSYLVALNVYMAEYLQVFDIPFTAQIKDDLDVVCMFPGVGEKPAARLSGGQRVALGIAFRFAVYKLFASELGFMVLDEPTAHLDDDKIQSVIDVLQSVRRYAHNTGMQLIVITHEPALAAAFDHVIRL